MFQCTNDHVHICSYYKFNPVHIKVHVYKIISLYLDVRKKIFFVPMPHNHTSDTQRHRKKGKIENRMPLRLNWYVGRLRSLQQNDKWLAGLSIEKIMNRDC